MDLDMRTIVFFTMLFNLMFGMGMLVFNKQKKPYSGISFIGSGFIWTGFGFLLMFLRDFISPFISVVVCNTAILIGVVIVFRGILMIYDKHYYKWYIDAILLILFFISFIYYLNYDPNINMRVIIICIYLIYYYIMCLSVITYKPIHNIASVKWFMGGYLVIDSIFYLFRIIWTINEAKMSSFMEAGLVHSIGIITFALLSLVISFGVFIVVNEIANNELLKMANIDSLTQLYNRRALTSIVLPTINLDKTGQVTNSVVICDIDYFKSINDNYGHDAGDFVLKKVSELLVKNTRSTDITGRYGGDEFLIYFPNTDTKTVCTICDGLRKTISNESFIFNSVELNVTLSFGIHTCTKDEFDKSECIRLADNALYIAKEKGRNRCEIK